MRSGSGFRRPSIRIRTATAADGRFARGIASAIGREVGREAIGLARRSPALIREKMAAGRAVIATASGAWIGFCYVSAWDGGRFVSTSALIIRAAWRRRGIARRIKERALALVRRLHPQARLFGLTTSPAVSKINAALGFVPVPYREIARDPEFWKGCEGCPFHALLLARRGRSCRCRAMAREPGALPPLAFMRPGP